MTKLHQLGISILLLALAPASVAEVRVKTLADGSRMISNESQKQRARRVSTRLLPVPEARIKALISQYARQKGMSPRLVQAVVQVESGYNPRALSSKGAMGLMQLMPETAKELRVRNAYDPDQNIRGGTEYLSQQLDRFGSLSLALAAYNAGPTAVSRYGGIPPYRETQDYVRKVLALYLRNPPEALREHARDQARQRRDKIATREAKEARHRGEKVFVTRDENNQIVFTTVPPDSN